MNNSDNTNLNTFNADIDLIKLLRILIRGKFFILSICTFTTLIAIIRSFTETPIWEGEMNIVVKTDNVENQNANFRNFSLLREDSSKKTEQIILTSPSVLMPVFEYVKNYNKENNIVKNNFTFKNWVNTELNTAFEEDSTVMKINYQNSDKKLIMDVLNLISKKYQDYSKSNQEKKILNSINYLGIQREDMIKKSNASMKNLNKFTLENRLGDIDGFVKLSNQSLNNNQSQKAEELTNERKKEINIPKSGERYAAQLALLEKYETQYLDASSKLKPKSTYLNYLENKITNIKSSLKRPNQILIKYRELYREAYRDEILLSNIENNLQSLKIEKLKILEPWQIISSPTIGEYPVSPNKKVWVLSTFLSTAIISSLITILREKLSGKIYEKDTFKSLLDVIFIDDLYLKNINLEVGVISKIINKSKYKEGKKIDILNFSSLNFQTLKKLLDVNNLFSSEQLDINKINILENHCLLIIEKGNITHNDIILINKINKLNTNKILGWFNIDNQKDFK